jgi:hypothetical protein
VTPAVTVGLKYIVLMLGWLLAWIGTLEALWHVSRELSGISARTVGEGVERSAVH